ncbi:hypothetical protein [Paludisphaera sp.]|uniref:hypothetical protein n=1 Tax=Paludisphaera sp. TaxID=2017432 RepID=UPI00301D11CC
MPRRERIVWVVMHYEIMGPSHSSRVDSVQFHVASSLEKAEAYIRSHWVESHSWWQVHPHVVDSDESDEGDEVHYYSHRGTRLKAAPIKRAVAAYQKYAERHPERFPPRTP